jgi:hypothetical protein
MASIARYQQLGHKFFPLASLYIMFISLEELRLLEHRKPDFTTLITTIVTTTDLSLLLEDGTCTGIAMTML